MKPYGDLFGGWLLLAVMFYVGALVVAALFGPIKPAALSGFQFGILSAAVFQAALNVLVLFHADILDSSPEVQL